MNTLAQFFTEAARVAKLEELHIDIYAIKYLRCMYNTTAILSSIDWSLDWREVKFALAIVEGKPVFAGDILYSEDGDKHIAPYVDTGKKMLFEADHKWTWNPPKSKTVMIELTREDAEYWLSLDPNPRFGSTDRYNQASTTFYNTVKTALKDISE